MDTAAAPRKGFDVVAYLKLFRFPLVFTAIADSAAGYLLLGHGPPEVWVLALLALASSGLYFFGMAMNDIADLERDRTLAPTRVLPSGRIAKSNAIYAGLIVLALSLEAVIWLGMTGYFAQVIIPWLVAVGAILLYDFGILKVPPMMGGVRVSNLLLGVCVGMGMGYKDYLMPPWECLIFAIPEFVYVSALTYVSTLEDQEPDRKRLWVGGVAMVLAAFLASSILSFIRPIFDKLPLGYAAWDRFRWNEAYRFDRWERLSWVALGISALLAGWILFRVKNARDRKGVMLVVRDGIAGIILLDTALVLSGTHDVILGLTVGALVIPTAASVALFKRLA